MKTGRTLALLHLADNLACFRQRLHHLLAFFSSPDRVVAFFEEVVKFVDAIHMFEQFSLHLILGVSTSRLATSSSKTVSMPGASLLD